MALLAGNLEELGSSLWGSESRMTGPFPPWTVTLKGDERSSRLHFSSSNWAAVIREDSLTHPPPLSLFCTSPLDPSFFDFRSGGGNRLHGVSAPPQLSHVLFLSPVGQWEMFNLQHSTRSSGADFVVSSSCVS